uniref:Uncharacterized protein LOC114334544 n=1 Tax=Diabrotica virgifera virgifera TaxID=50390 RepID=A0A6P7G029_DIAVI
MNFRREEMTDMIWILGECFKNSLLATRIYKERYPQRRQPNKRAFDNLLDRSHRTGSVLYEAKGKTKTIITDENALNVLLAVTENPHTSIRNITREQDISYGSIHNILKKKQHAPSGFVLEWLSISFDEPRFS